MVGLILLSGAAAEEPVRKWRDSTGQYEFEARLIKVQGGSVFLKGADGIERNVPLEKLSAADRDFLKSRENPPPAAATTGPATPAAPAAPATPAMPAAPAAPLAPSAPNPVLPVRTWTPQGMPPIEAAFLDFRKGSNQSSEAAMFPTLNTNVVLRTADGKETLVNYGRLSEADKEYLNNRTVARSLSDAERERLSQPVGAEPVPEVVQSLVVVEAAAPDQVRRWPAFVVQTIDGTSYVRTEYAGLRSTDGWQQITGFSIAVRNADGTTRKVAAKLVGYINSFATMILAAPAADLPKPLLEFREKLAGNEQPVTLYGLRLNDDTPAGWELVRSAATFRKRNPEFSTFDVDAGIPGSGAAIVVGEGNSYGGLGVYGKDRKLVKPDGAEVTLASFQHRPARSIVEPGTRSNASNVKLRKGKEPGVAEITFLWNDLIPNGTTPRLVVNLPEPDLHMHKDWLQNRRMSTVASFSYHEGGLSRVTEQKMLVLECTPITHPAEAATVVTNITPPPPTNSPGNRPMKATLKYDAQLLGEEFPVSLAVVFYDQNSGKYVGGGEVRLYTTISFKVGAQAITQY